MTKEQREEVESRIYKTMERLDRSGTNSDYYRKLLSGMSDAEFLKLMKKKYPYKFHHVPYVVEPSVDDIENALNFLNSSLMEKVTLPYMYKNKDGEGVQSQECMVVYVHLPKVQQMVVKKIKNAIDIDNRDMKTGRLNGNDKGAANTDREFEGLATLGLTASMDELARFRADDMVAKNVGYNTIKVKGIVSLKDLPKSSDGVLSNHLMSTYMIGAHLYTNVMNAEYYTPYTLKNKQKDISRDID